MNLHALGALLLGATLLPLGGGAHRKVEEGNRLYLEGAYDQALRAYTEAQILRPEAPELYYDIGNVLYRRADYAGAAEAFTRALTTATGELHPAAAYNLGNALYRQGRYPEAARAYRRALRLTPEDLDAKRNLELALREQKRAESGKPKPSGETESSSSERETAPPDVDRPSQEGREPDRQAGERTEPPRPGDSAEASREPAQEMTAEQAARLLDGVTEGERKNLEDEQRRRAAARSAAASGKDW